MIALNGKIYIAEKHFPWTIQKSMDWNQRRGVLYVNEMIQSNKKNFYPYTTENIEIVKRINKNLESEKNL
jgi:hypothetical protein